MSVHLVQSTTPGTPLFTESAGGMCGVLDYVLVEVAGWELVYAVGANKRVYRPRVGARHYLRVQDGINSFGLIGAACSDFESMTGVDAGTNETVGSSGSDTHWQGNGGGPHPWVAVVDERTVTFLHKRTPGTPYGYEVLHWGDYRARNTADAHRTVICAKSNYYAQVGGTLVSGIPAVVGHGWAVGRLPDGTFGPLRTGNWVEAPPAAQALAVWADPARGGGILGGAEPVPGLDGLGVLARVHLGHITGHRHLGWCRGLWALKNPTTGIADRDTAFGHDVLTGRTFLFVRDLTDGSTTVYGTIVLETSDTWDVR